MKRLLIPCLLALMLNGCSEKYLIVDGVNSNSKYITGMSEGSIIRISKGDDVIGVGKPNKAAYFKIPVPMQPKGTELTVEEIKPNGSTTRVIYVK